MNYRRTLAPEIRVARPEAADALLSAVWAAEHSLWADALDELRAAGPPPLRHVGARFRVTCSLLARRGGHTPPRTATVRHQEEPR